MADLIRSTSHMRILLAADPILPVPPAGYGGIERIVDGLVRALRASGNTVALMAKLGSTAPVDTLFAWPGARVRDRFDTARNALALARAVRHFRPDVVHSFSRLAYLSLLLPARIPKVMSYQRHTGGRPVAVAARIGGRSLRFTGCSDFICAMGRKAGGDWRTIPNFVDLDAFTFVRSVPTDAPLVFLSRIEAIKGPDLAIAVALASGRRLVLAGNRAENGEQLSYWDRQIAPHLGRDGIDWIGEVGDARKNDLLGRAAALIVPVQWDEPFGIVFAEALACGTPILSCRRGALPEIVEEGRTGLFFENVSSGVDAVSRLGELDRTSCRKAAETRFCLERCSAQYLALYGEMLNGA